MGMETREPLPLLICSGGVGLQGKYHIWYYTISCGARRPVPCMPWSCGLGHFWWCGSCLVLWISGVISPQLMFDCIRQIGFNERWCKWIQLVILRLLKPKWLILMTHFAKKKSTTESKNWDSRTLPNLSWGLGLWSCIWRKLHVVVWYVLSF